MMNKQKAERIAKFFRGLRYQTEICSNRPLRSGLHVRVKRSETDSWLIIGHRSIEAFDPDSPLMPRVVIGNA